MRFLRWLAHEAWEKINIFETIREIKKLGVKYGLRFLILAVVWECIEDGLFPYLSWRAGVPQLIPLFLILHFEPIVYPVGLWAFKTYDRIRGRTAWEPDRSAMSSHWRTALKVLLYRVASIGAFWLILRDTHLSLWMLSIYAGVMVLFNFAHERIWHDSNFGITSADRVEAKRVALKTLTYRGVSTLVMGMTLFGFLQYIPWGLLLGYQGVMLVLYAALECIWARSSWGIQTVPNHA